MLGISIQQTQRELKLTRALNWGSRVQADKGKNHKVMGVLNHAVGIMIGAGRVTLSI